MKKNIKLIILTAIFGLAFTLTACNFSANNSEKNKKTNTKTNTNTQTNNPSGQTPVTPQKELEDFEMPLTLQAITDGKIILSGRDAFEEIKIQRNDGLISDSADNIPVKAGDKILFYGSKYEYKESGATNLTINCTADCFVYGNVMSLIYFTDFEGKTQIPDNYALQKLFLNNTHIKNHESLDIVLPATTLSDSCYKMMFYGCTGLTRAPELPATTLTKECYSHMFYKCKNINSIKCMATDISAQDCTLNWVAEVSKTGTFSSAQENTIWKTKFMYSGVPKGWTANPPLDVVNAKELPLTLEAIYPGTITLSRTNEYVNLKYSINGGEKTAVSTEIISTEIEVKKGDKVCLYAEGPDEDDDTYYLTISCSEAYYLYGNIMSLLYPENFSTQTQITKKAAFKQLFAQTDSPRLKNGPIELVLPATTLTESCYESMFEGCSNLTIAPELPATELVNTCYKNMFAFCSNLAVPPELPATTLADNCYENMFASCTNLSVAPELPATTMATQCYDTMFYKCEKLTTPPELPATTLATQCYSGMFNYCTGLTTAPKLPATTLATQCYLKMFQHCTGLISAPDLPAETLATSCYAYMFNECQNLFIPPELPATTLAQYCYKDMFHQCYKLVTAPALPATAMKKGCYEEMFSECTHLTNAPVLPATNLVADWADCYKNMFINCSSLEYVDCKVKTIDEGSTLASFCTDWLKWVADYGILITPKRDIWAGANTGIFPTNWKRESQIPLTIEAIEDGLLGLKYHSNYNNFTVYKNYVKIQDLEHTDVTLSAGDKIWICADGLNADYIDDQCTRIFADNTDFYVYGNIMSLVKREGYGELESLVPTNNENGTLTGEYYFCSLFRTESFQTNHLRNHPTEKLILPATELTTGCYKDMFYNCSNLTEAPELPATNLAEECYGEMFYGCSNLTKAPELPATELTTGCYKDMFYNCSNLTEAPELPATTLADGCYMQMFEMCSSLTSAPALPATTLAEECYEDMFSNCNSLVTAPELPAPRLVDNCYKQMFGGCSKLNYIKCLATEDESRGRALRNWTDLVSATGTFVIAPGAEQFWSRGISGIPEGWTVVEAGE